MPKIVENAIVIYTDGSMYPKGRRAGYGMVFVHHDRVGDETVIDAHAPPGVRGVTGNEMELQACVIALERVRDLAEFQTVDRIVIRSDSRYVTGNYMYAFGAWPRQKWHGVNGRPIEHADIWRHFVREYRKIRKRVELEWVKGKSSAFTKQVDRLAKESAKSPLSRRVHTESTRRKVSAAETIRGSVIMRGQTMTIRIVSAKRMRQQKVWSYRYEVISTEGGDFGKVDVFYFDRLLRHSYTYEVRVNDNTANPRILEILQEMGPTGAES